jgi:microcystin-dependent protein
MPYTKVILSADPTFLQGETYSAQKDRSLWADIISPGVVGQGDFAVSWVSALNLSIAAGKAWIKGLNVTDQGMYRQYEPNAQSISVGAGHATLPRLDQIILRVMDQAHDSSGVYESRIEVVPGTPTASANLDNRLGAANLTALDEGSKNVLLLADVLVPNGASAINATNVRNRRVRATVGRGDAFSSGLPPGCYLWRAVENTPDKALRCDGTLVSRQTYSDLFDVIGTTFGVGDGSTTFQLPNTKGRGLMDRDTAQAEFVNPGTQGGAKTHTLTVPEIPPHSHLHGQLEFFSAGGTASIRIDGLVNQPTSTVGSGAPHNNLHPYHTGVLYITF